MLTVGKKFEPKVKSTKNTESYDSVVRKANKRFHIPGEKTKKGSPEINQKSSLAAM